MIVSRGEPWRRESTGGFVSPSKVVVGSLEVLLPYCIVLYCTLLFFWSSGTPAAEESLRVLFNGKIFVSMMAGARSTEYRKYWCTVQCWAAAAAAGRPGEPNRLISELNVPGRASRSYACFRAALVGRLIEAPPGREEFCAGAHGAQARRRSCGWTGEFGRGSHRGREAYRQVK